MPRGRSKTKTREKARNTDHSAVPASDVERAITKANIRKPENQQKDQRVSIHVHSIRARLVDSDGVSAKAAIDGLVASGILKDDCAKYVAETTYSQQVGSPERTIIDIYEYTEE
jgi:Holliday junction resolvase RusA-like endonuclease